MKEPSLNYLDFKTKIYTNLLSLLTIFFLIFYGKLVCPFLEGLAFIDFFKLLLVLYFIEIILRELVFKLFGRVKPGESPIRTAYKLSVAVWLTMGVLAVILFEAIYTVHIPWHSHLKLLSGYWLLGAGINCQIEYTLYEKAYNRFNHLFSDYSKFFDSLILRITESMFIFTIVPSVTLLIMVIRYVFQDKIIPVPVAIEVGFILIFLVSVALFAGYFYSKQLASDTKSILAVIQQLENGNYRAIPKIRTDEIGKISFNINQMIANLKNKEAVEKAFGHFVDPQIAENFLNEFIKNEHTDLRQKGENKRLTILMSDLRNFTQFSQHKEPEEVTFILNHYFSKMVEIIEKHGGIIDKFLGDGLMAIFGLVKKNQLTPSTNAVNAALEMQKALKEINREMNLSLGFGVGIHHGNVLAGYLGSKNRLEFTVIGSTVNQASRIEQETKGDHIPDILFSNEVAKELNHDRIETKFIKEAKVKGIEQAIQLFSSTGLNDPKASLKT